MAWSSAARVRQTETSRQRLSTDAELLPAEALAPLLAGAYVRGIADTLEALGFPALFLDCEGSVLATNACANARLGGDLRLEAGHLMARSAADNAVLSRLIAETIAAAPGAGVKVAHLPGTARDIYAVDTSGRAALQGQRLGAILVLADRDDAAASAILSRLALLPAGA